MYPNLYYLVDDFFGIKLNGLRLVNSFGFFVALEFVASGFVLYHELKRKEALGEFTPTEDSIIVGAPASLNELLTSFFFGFWIFWRFVRGLTAHSALTYILCGYNIFCWLGCL
jgi:hypothetical protein